MIEKIKENVVVKEYQKSDFPIFLSQLCHNEKWTNIFSLWNLDNDSAFTFFANHLNQYKELNIKEYGLMLPIFTKNGLLMGECGYEYNETAKRVEVFLGLVESARGKGYAKEIVEALCEIALDLGINELHAIVPYAHVVGIKVFNNSPFKLENEFDLELQNTTVKMAHYVYKKR